MTTLRKLNRNHRPVCVCKYCIRPTKYSKEEFDEIFSDYNSNTICIHCDSPLGEHAGSHWSGGIKSKEDKNAGGSCPVRGLSKNGIDFIEIKYGLAAGYYAYDYVFERSKT